ncbi:MAG TPA: hypothetical protein VEB00_01445 [Clostridia bacterium]|nr:hypothetical protein [Clostridia bacterium]
MSILKINPTPSLPPTKSSTSGYSNSGDNKRGNKGGNEGNYSGLTFQDIFKQNLDKYGAKQVS